MSTMPAKKKSCFQITSVTQAQVAGSTIIDDTESIDDPDDPRTDDVSSEIFGVSRTDLGVSDCSFIEEGPNHTGEHLNGPVNGILSIKSIGTGGRNTPVSLGGSVPVPAATQPIVPAPTGQPSSVSSCSSRFRVIKLDHGTGEPFRRGRWTCTEFYEKESESNRTVDSVKPAVTYEHNTDSGLGLVTNSVLSSFSVQSVENIDGGPPRVPIPSSEPLQQGYTLPSQIGSVASAFQPTGYATTITSHVNVQPVVSQTFIPNSLNGIHQAPMMPLATQPQQLAFSNAGISSGLPDYHLQHFHATSLPMVPPSSQAPLSPPGPGGQVLLAQGADAALAPVVTPVSVASGAMGITVSSPVTIPSQSGIVSVPTTISAAEDHRPRSDVLPLTISTVKPHIPEGLSLTTPAVSLFGIAIPVDGDDDSASGASVVAIDNKIEQAMDLVKNHLMYAVREEVEVLKEQIKELYERNSVLERENAVLKSLANSEQLNKLSSQLSQVNSVALQQLHQHSVSTNNSNALVGHYEVVKSTPHQPNITSA
ncbi:TSC22 domain family protein 2-like [Boleophthalmus pectinirostris]|uniref:TSC22 domain family protein 2-like n=1 Tax=Boleophthalmus pectinirostris TaxID=150288 RepID=UPI000A1C371F|nr:TSC22 domain family protein 2-like [Boleophthalmus pectinirostris]